MGDGSGGDKRAAPTLLPWWESDALGEDGETAAAPPPEDISPDILEGIKPSEGVGLKSAYNVIALW